MKLKTNYAVTITVEEAGKALSRLVEKKTGKKVIEFNITSEQIGEKQETAFLFTLQGDESVIDKEGA
jgi:hypothetical protein